MNMTKKQWIALMSALVLMLGIGLAAFNASAEPSTFDPQPLSNTTNGDDEEDDEQELAALMDQVVLTKADAEQRFLDQHPDYTVTEIELDEEDGVPVYEVEGTNASGTEIEMEINAIDGSVMSEEQDDEDDDEQNESEQDDTNEASYIG